MLVKTSWLSLFAVIAISVLLLAFRAFGILQGAWHTYYTLYLVAAIGHTWFVLILLAKEDLFPRKYVNYADEKIAVIIPCYNEEPQLLRATVKSVLEAKGNKQILIVDDGSTNGTEKVLFEYANEPRIKVYGYGQNRGKREALYHVIKHFLDDSAFVVTMDSDTVFDENALVSLVSALKTGNIGAASGDVKILNEKDNLLTRMEAAYYWSALNIQRRSQSALGMVACCSGAIAGYRSSILKSVIDSFVSQRFLGEKCTYSEDRHLTNLVLKSGHDVVFVPEAIAYTYVPNTYRGFLKQQLRWRRGFIKEALFALTFMWRTKPVLFFEIVVWELLIPFLSFGIVVLVVLNTIFDPIYTLAILIPSLITITIIRHIPMVFYAPHKIFGMLCFTFFSLFVMYWQSIYALLTVKSKGWITR